MQYPQFVEVMTTTLTQRATRASEVSKAKNLTEAGQEAMQQALLPFELTATAYRRCAQYCPSTVMNNPKEQCYKRIPSFWNVNSLQNVCACQRSESALNGCAWMGL